MAKIDADVRNGVLLLVLTVAGLAIVAVLAVISV
jgi:hypothetical protein